MTKFKVYMMGFVFLSALAFLLCYAAPANAAPCSPDIILSGKDVVEVYDGDTIFVNIPSVHPVFGKRIGVRIANIDTPEKRSRCKRAQDKANEKALALKAADIIARQIRPQSTLILTKIKRDKLFRINAVVLVDGRDVTEQVIAANLARPYYGGTKQSWCAI